MTDKTPTKEMFEYIQSFEQKARKSFENGESDILMLYRTSCNVCHKQFEMFKKEMDEKNAITGRIYPVEIMTRLGMMLINESMAWKKEMNDPDLEIKYTPTFIDAKTHQIIVYGVQEKDILIDMLDPKTIKKRRDEFAESIKLKGKNGCDAVACGLKERVNHAKAKDALKEKNGKKK
jgi:hypothetical protein